MDKVDRAAFLIHLEKEEERLRMALPMLAIQPSFRLGLPVSKDIETRNKKIDQALSQRGRKTILEYLDFLSLRIGRYQST